MSYAVKELFLTLQGEGVQAGRRAVFVRFAGCNLWSGREADRAAAVCRFCDTDFAGIDGDGGARFSDAEALAASVAACWGPDEAERYAVLTGGEPMLQIDSGLIDALHARGFAIGVESNGTIPAIPGIDWLCVSPKEGSEVVQRSGDELKLVWPQPDSDIAAMERWNFAHFLVQPMDCTDAAAARDAAIAFVMARPKWRLTTQAHKTLGLR
ncbi:MAG: 7-carboxy-7-deazaguanine synthase [Sphingomonadaceae bacterium]|nr:7-carboxy-7-deazaguanine synthase [Sphingomonadaceae bacterium]